MINKPNKKKLLLLLLLLLHRGSGAETLWGYVKTALGLTDKATTTEAEDEVTNYATSLADTFQSGDVSDSTITSMSSAMATKIAAL